MSMIDLAAALERARAAATGPSRTIIGLVGPPGSGKSTLAAAIAEAVAGAVAVPMDGFHLPQARLRELGIRDRMGAIDTFDASAYRSTLLKLRDDFGRVLLPGFDRGTEEPTPRAIDVPARCRLVVTEGNYLLDAERPWPLIRALLDEVWFIELDDAERVRRLTARHLQFGKTPEAAAAWVREVDEPNAARVSARRADADVVVTP